MSADLYNVRLKVMVSAEMRDRIEAARGEVPLSAWVRGAIEARLAPPPAPKRRPPPLPPKAAKTKEPRALEHIILDLHYAILHGIATLKYEGFTSEPHIAPLMDELKAFRANDAPDELRSFRSEALADWSAGISPSHTHAALATARYLAGPDYRPEWLTADEREAYDERHRNPPDVDPDTNLELLHTPGIE